MDKQKEIKAVLRAISIPTLYLDWGKSEDFTHDPFIAYQQIEMSKGKLLEIIAEAIDQYYELKERNV